MPRPTPTMLACDRRGAALTEFAIVLPVLLVMFLSGYQLTDALSCKRKVTTTTRAIADLSTQPKTLTAAEVDANLSAATKILYPYSASNALVRVSQIYTSAAGVTKIIWSRAIGGTIRPKGATMTLPTSLKVNNTYLLFSETSYTYTPVAGFGVVGKMSLNDSIYMSPRNSPSIPCSDC